MQKRCCIYMNIGKITKNEFDDFYDENINANIFFILYVSLFTRRRGCDRDARDCPSRVCGIL